MGKVLIEKMLPALAKIDWPNTPEATELGRKTYDIGLDKAEEYKRDARVLAAALRTFQTGDSRPYAFAGVAYVLVMASRENDGSYAEIGLSSALEWLEKAQELAPDVVDINMIEAFIYVYSGRFADARLVLDFLESVNSNDYHVLRAEIAYWQEQGLLDETVSWYEKAAVAADSVPQKLRLRSSLGDCYLTMKQYEKAVEIYTEAIHFSRENPWLWHNLSLAYWNMEEDKEAARCNKHALTLNPDFPEARKMEAMLKERMEAGGLKRRFFGR